jgi:hypothetical protein
MGIARWEREQEERAARKQAVRVSDIARVKLESAQADAAARLVAITAEMEIRRAEIALLNQEATSASNLRASDQLMLRKLRHADEDAPLPKRNGKRPHPQTVGKRAAKP